ncbi:uncharacterized protein LOC113209134 [Frankliniella occidentalis]|uniref:Uncharacterized protein LOC113209134 n=1 Tax=Frankliniella occidentalis TaxID=133901 RepID=A0A6J1SV11_FRAOC|nr:uncharacterized protein LOC113209134 [Frankliniella occidentalis]
MASVRDTATFFTEGSSNQFDHVLSLYPEALRLKAETKAKKPEELIKLDNWYQNELPKRIKSRGKDAHLNHEELVQTMKWKQTRGKFYPQLSYLVKVNTPRAVMLETKKAFRKLPNLEQAITALSNLKGVGTTMASALLAAAAPDKAPFMADECLMAIPEIEGIDYTTKEYLNFVQHIQQTVERLNSEGSPSTLWNPHNVELALWTHYVASELKPEMLDSIPSAVKNGKVAHQNGDVESPATKTPVIDPSSEDSNLDPANNGKSGSASVTASDTNVDENSTTSFTEDSMDKPLTPASSGPVAVEPESASNGAGGEETNDSIATSDSATNDSTVLETPIAALSQGSATEEEESRSSVIETTEESTVETEKRKSDDSEVPVAKKLKTDQDEEVQPQTNAEVVEEAK